MYELALTYEVQLVGGQIAKVGIVHIENDAILPLGDNVRRGDGNGSGGALLLLLHQ